MDVATVRQYCGTTAAALAGGTAISLLLPQQAARFEAATWPLIALLMFTMCARIHWRDVQVADDGRRFLRTMALMQAVTLPLLVALLLLPLPPNPTLQLSLLLVLLAPSTYWVVTFTHLGRGSVHQASLATPVLLAGQLVLVPAWLLAMAPATVPAAFALDRVVIVLAALVLAPMALAMILDRLSDAFPALRSLNRSAPRLSTPLGVALIFLLSATHGREWIGHGTLLAWPLLGFGVFLLLTPALGWIAGRAARLSPVATRTLIFSLTARNALVALPFALLLPEPALAAAAILIGAAMEFAALALYAHLVPQWIPDTQASAPSKSG